MKSRLINNKEKNLSNYYRPGYSIYQATVL